ncbi:hypothetical protein B9Z55_017936 [Caenorhabditis nigoni]|uniref:DUF281 domain-containing protein n=1 Tax=Caenorhabditis nigoni TaxID=1611254 RepID=A0A2G5TCF1_9PELO|nr:hypothetical protein B9Z55_017936 [Caenorhabditis nigoni]
MMDDNTEIVINQAVENGCNVATVTCKRTDDQICDRITHQGAIGNVVVDVFIKDNTNEAVGQFFCQADGLYAAGSSTQISQVFCKFDGCKPAAPACPCNLASLAPTSNPPELVYEAEWTGPPGECMSTKIGCRKTNDQLCQLIELRDVSGVQVVSAIDNSIRETTSIKCQPDGTFNYLGL